MVEEDAFGVEVHLAVKGAGVGVVANAGFRERGFFGVVDVRVVIVSERGGEDAGVRGVVTAEAASVVAEDDGAGSVEVDVLEGERQAVLEGEGDHACPAPHAREVTGRGFSCAACWF